MFVAIGVLSIAYYLTFKNYHQSLVALDQLKEFLVNPNARVANKQQGEQILQIAEEEERKLSPASAETFETSPDQLLQSGPSIAQQQELIKALIAQNALLQQQRQYFAQYQAPRLQAETPVMDKVEQPVYRLPQMAAYAMPPQVPAQF